MCVQVEEVKASRERYNKLITQSNERIKTMKAKVGADGLMALMVISDGSDG